MDLGVKLVDLDGDGRADVLVGEDDAFIWYPSLSEEGFDAAHRVSRALNEEDGPRIVFADGTETIFLADLSGDGLTDIARIRNGEVCYWANQGFGRFGPKVAMDNAPVFDHEGKFDPKRLRVADIDGSGTADIIYLHGDGVRLYFNQSGNGWSEAQLLSAFPQIDDLSRILPVDLLGNGTACLVWSSPLPGNARNPMRYINLMGGEKPHLLTTMSNNLGAETRINYATSTRFYLQDKFAETPWVTKLPFPVHVVENVETFDYIGRSLLTTRYAYHHGYFDGEEREFRGFGMVEQWDSEAIGALSDKRDQADNLSPEFHVPPIHTKTWFHTGCYLESSSVSEFFAGSPDGSKRGEYFREPGRDTNASLDLLLDDTLIPGGLTVDEEREACRALKGTMLRQEVYADDASDESPNEMKARALLPYKVIEQNYTVQTLQHRGLNRHAVFVAHPNESISYNYERNPVDPRIQHTLTLEVDSFGNVCKQASVGYGRRAQIFDQASNTLIANPGLPALSADRLKQTLSLVSYSEFSFTNSLATLDAHRTPLPCESITFELTGYDPTGKAGRFQPSDFVEPIPDQPGKFRHTFNAPEVAYENVATGARRRRPIECLRTLYRTDDLTDLSPLGTVGEHAFLGESYKLAFTPGLLQTVFQRKRDPQAPEVLIPDPATTLGGQGGDQGGYIKGAILKATGNFPATDNDECWWVHSGRVFFSINPIESAALELKNAQAHFFTPRRYRDAFGQDACVDLDQYDLLLEETRDALQNRVTVSENDYRALQPRLVTDPNRNQTKVAFDLLGLVAATAVMGKALPAKAEGDSLDGIVSDPAPNDIDDFFGGADPRAAAVGLLAKATSRIVYDLHRFARTKNDNPNDSTKWLPASAATVSRETHVSELAPAQNSKIHLSFSYSDGFGREIQKKVQAEAGPIVDGGAVSPTRWVGTGWTIFNNKGKPVLKYEPFFSGTHEFEFGAINGVSSVLFYDPAERVIATLHPNHTYEKVLFGPWHQATYDVNDTCAPRNEQTGDPRTDTDIGSYVADYFTVVDNDPANPWITWRNARINGQMGALERQAAIQAASHADTPSTAHLDVLGRHFLTVVQNRVECAGHDGNGKEESFSTRVELDIEGNQRAVRDTVVQSGDALGRQIMRYDYDMLGHRIHQQSMEAGERWMLNDVAGKPIRIWDSRGHNHASKFDALRRPIEQSVLGTTDQSDPRTIGQGVCIEKIVYGETVNGSENLNLRTRVFQHFDPAGVTASERIDGQGNAVAAIDFKGNVLQSTRKLLKDYKALPDWRGNPDLQDEVFVSNTRYDALNRPIQSVTPQTKNGQTVSVVQPVYNEANLLEAVDVWLERNARPDALLDKNADPPSPVGIGNIDYDAKGQRTRIDFKNGATTKYKYDPLTFRLVNLYTRRGNTFTDDCNNPQPPLATMAAPESPLASCGLQNLSYIYDPAGNITHIQDDAQQTIYFQNQRVEPSNDYVYDATYRLIQATGRERLNQVGEQPIPHSWNDDGRVGILSSDGNGRFSAGDKKLGTYVEQYVYDGVGNFARMQHVGRNPASTGWTREYAHTETSRIEDGVDEPLKKTSNRLSSTAVRTNGDAPVLEPYLHDLHGNMIRMPHLGGALDAPNMQWDYKDQLQHVDLAGGNDAYYVYDASGQRTRKVVEKGPGLIEERIYLGGFEIYRKHNGPIDANSAQLERTTLHVMDDKQRVALVETRTLDIAGNDPAPRQLIRYQFGNHLGSASLELDDQSLIISYEEYAPYGSTTYQAARSGTECPKRYRYTGKERDDESGFGHHEARYFAQWLGRWTSGDPLGIADGVNLFQYCSGRPSFLRDPNGTEGRNPTAQEASTLEARGITDPEIQQRLVNINPRRSKKPLADLKRRSVGQDAWKTSKSIRGWLKNEARRSGSNSPYKWRNPRGMEGGHPQPRPFKTHGDKGGPMQWETRLDNDIKGKLFDGRRSFSHSPDLPTESPRGGPSADTTTAPESGGSMQGTSQAEAPEVGHSQVEAPKVEAPKVEVPKVEVPKVDVPSANISTPRGQAALGKTAGVAGALLLGRDLYKAKDNAERVRIVRDAAIGSAVVHGVSKAPVAGPWVAAGLAGLALGTGIGTWLAEDVIPAKAQAAYGKVITESAFGVKPDDLELLEKFEVGGFRPFAP